MKFDTKISYGLRIYSKRETYYKPKQGKQEESAENEEGDWWAIRSARDQKPKIKFKNDLLSKFKHSTE